MNNKLSVRVLCAVLTVVLLVGLVPATVLAAPQAAGGETDATAKTDAAASVKVVRGNQKYIVLQKGTKRRVYASAYDASGNVVGGVKITWNSADTSIATVNQSGWVTAKGTGVTRITARVSKTRWFYFVLRVDADPLRIEEIRVSNAPKTMNRQTSKVLKASSWPTRATGVSFTYVSSNSNVLRVDRTGTLTAIKKGTATITVKGGGKRYSFKVKVTIPPARSVHITPQGSSLQPGQKLQFTATVNPAAAEQRVVWSSSNNTVARVENGLVTALHYGETFITATAVNGKKTSVVLKVVEKQYSVYNNYTRQVVTGPANEIISQIVMAEMGSNPTEALKAQAVAVRTLLDYKISHGVTTPHMNMRSPNAAVRAAVASVDGRTLTYGGAPAKTLWTQSTPGYTNSGLNQFNSNAFPYLLRVTDPHGAAHVGETHSWSETQMRSAITKMIGRAPRKPSNQWITLVYHADSTNHYIDYAQVDGVAVTPDVFYNNLPGLSSPCITSWSYSGSTWSATTSGLGDGVGLSQTGAIGYANAGWNYTRILQHYYPSTTLAG